MVDPGVDIVDRWLTSLKAFVAGFELALIDDDLPAAQEVAQKMANVSSCIRDFIKGE